jgi:hypothetical protein
MHDPYKAGAFCAALLVTLLLSLTIAQWITFGVPASAWLGYAAGLITAIAVKRLGGAGCLPMFAAFGGGGMLILAGLVQSPALHAFLLSAFTLVISVTFTFAALQLWHRGQP